ncbi:MAG: T9SS type A sorting domain-containing protein [Bacteroidales bacterium]|nr:T9SS type A sorting domain-containing protein [Bacteroidales bacterium]
MNFIRISIIFIFFLVINQTPLFSQTWAEFLSIPGKNFYEIQKEFNKYWEGKTIEKGKGWKQFKRWEAFMEPRVYPSGNFNNAAFIDAYNQITEQSKDKKALFSNKYWKELGPKSVPSYFGGAGRLNCIEFSPVYKQTIYVGAPSGGLWISDDNGYSWRTTTDNLPCIGVSDIAIDPKNPQIIYIATGDGDFIDTYSIGILKSIDGGASWETTGLGASLGFNITNQRTVNRIIINPDNSNIMLAGASNGLYYSADAGKTWKMVVAGNFKDIKFKPGNSSIVYATSDRRLYTSLNGGSSFLLNTSFKLNTTSIRLAMAVTKAAPDYLYIVAANSSDQGFGGIYRSTNGGESFEIRSTTPNLLGWSGDGSDKGGQAWYDLAITASDIDKETVFIGGINIWKSINGGQSWTLNAYWVPTAKTEYVHADIHSLKFNSAENPVLYACTDGGLFISSNNGKNWTDRSNGLGIAQIYRLGSSATNPKLILTGWQDNGGNLMSDNNWVHNQGGDCMESIIDYNDNSVMYISMYNGVLFRSITSGMSWALISEDIKKEEQGAWITPLVIDNKDPDILYAGYYNIWKTSSKGNNWFKISDFSSTNVFQSIAVSPSDNKYIYAATYYTIFKTADGGKNWTNITTGLPQVAISYIAIDPVNPQKLWITLSGFNSGQKVYKSINGGINWTNISGSLPNIPVNCIVYEKGTNEDIYIGTDVGVYFRDALLKDWIPYSYSLPNVIVNELEIYYTDKKLRAATYGRGLWEVDLYSAVGINETNQNSNNKISILSNPSNDEITLSFKKKPESKTKLFIFNYIGQLVYSKDLNSEQIYKINTGFMQKGIYFVRVLSDDDSYTSVFTKI